MGVCQSGRKLGAPSVSEAESFLYASNTLNYQLFARYKFVTYLLTFIQQTA